VSKGLNRGLWHEVALMAFETLRSNKMRSALTILGVVIGITSIVGMTSLIRGFDESLRDMIRQLGPNTIILSKASAVSLAAGADFSELIRRPNLTVDDARAIERLAPSVGVVDIWMGQGLGGQTTERVFYGGERTPMGAVLGATEQFATVNFVKLSFGRFFTQAEVQRRRRVVVLGNNPYEALFAPSGIDPIGKKVRVGAIEYTVVGVLGKRPSPFPQADNFVVIPQTTHQVVFATNARQRFGGGSSAQITIVPVEGATRDQAVAEVEEIMRIRHGLKLDEPNDFEIGGQDAILRLWDQISRAVFLALVVISSVALMVGGIGVMAIMMISVTERTREIGVRKALGARRQEILFQFLAEAAVLTSVGGILGILCGAGIGFAISAATGFPISLPWWSFAIGLGFSASVGIFFGMVPAVRASRLDPIEALRYE
jgi:putative ABC transport system permease protein